MPAEVAERIEQHGGLWPSLVSVLPALAGVTRVVRRSTSAGLYRGDTGERLAGSGAGLRGGLEIFRVIGFV
jgi:hypothetical protein